MLTLEILKQIEPRGVIATGTTHGCIPEMMDLDCVVGLRWVAVRGVIHDWTIYYHKDMHDAEWIRQHGMKVMDKHIIQRLVPCDAGALGMYRF